MKCMVFECSDVVGLSNESWCAPVAGFALLCVGWRSA